MYTKLSIRPQMKISPQLVITGKLLQIPGSDLEQFINQELAENPALELTHKPDLTKAEVIHMGSGYPANRSMPGLQSFSSFEQIVENFAQRQSPLEKLVEQVSLLINKTDRDIAINLLYQLDYRGFLVMPTEQLVDNLGASHETIMRVIQVLQQLEPPGIGARNLRECFLIQCAHLEAEGHACQDVRLILTLAWDELLNQRWDRVAKKIQKSKKVVHEACQFMRLNFYAHPLAMLETSTDTETTLHYADLIVSKNNNINPPTYILEIPGEEDFEVKISTSFQKIFGTEVSSSCQFSLQEKIWMRTHLDRASVLVHALRQRWQTLRRIGEFLIGNQTDFLEHGPLHLKPMTRAVIAEKLKIHESTVSRAVNNKNIQLPNGRLIPLSDFFDPSLAVKEAILQVLKDNPRNLSDREIAERLQAHGMSLSRRTITKYRQKINISPGRRQSTPI